MPKLQQEQAAAGKELLRPGATLSDSILHCNRGGSFSLSLYLGFTESVHFHLSLLTSHSGTLNSS